MAGIQKPLIAPARVFGAALLLLAIGCQGQPVPADKKDYVGEWQGLGMTLLITPDGGVVYERKTGGGTTTIDAPIQEFQGDNFVVGLWFLTTTFEVQKTPYKDSDDWKMVVDGVTLVKRTS